MVIKRHYHRVNLICILHGSDSAQYIQQLSLFRQSNRCGSSIFFLENVYRNLEEQQDKTKQPLQMLCTNERNETTTITIHEVNDRSMENYTENKCMQKV